MTNYEVLLNLVRQNGMDYKWAAMFVKKLKDDEMSFPTDDVTKQWALKRGFYPGRVELYGLTDTNYRSFLPDYNYFMIHPINHHFRKWIDDKLTLKYVLNSNGSEDSMPEYYLYVENNDSYTYLMDIPSYIKHDRDFILNLLKDKGSLIIKPNSGTSGGRGIIKLEWKNAEIRANNSPITMTGFCDLISCLRNHIVTEYAHQHEDLARIWADSECTLRIIMIKLPQTDLFTTATWHSIVSYARFGSSVSGGASNLSSGGIGIGFDFMTGEFHDFGIRYKRFCSDGRYFCYEHPDTFAAWKGFKLPNWDKARKELELVCRNIGSLDYLGFDVIITQNGIKLCEINSHPAVDYEQIMCGPVLADADAKDFFTKHGLYRVDNSELWNMYLQSQQ